MNIEEPKEHIQGPGFEQPAKVGDNFSKGSFVYWPEVILFCAVVLTILVQAFSMKVGSRATDYSRVTGQFQGIVVAPINRPVAGAIRFAMLDKVLGKILLEGPDLPWLETGHGLPGDQVSGFAVMQLLRKPQTLKDETSYDAQLFRKGFNAHGKVESLSVVRATNDREPSITDQLATKLLQQFGRSEALAAILTLSLGKSDLLSRELKATFRDTGLSHLLVVSGFHVGVVYLVVFKVISWIYSRSKRLLLAMPRKYFASAAALVASMSYSYLVSGGIATLRALVAIGVCVCGALLCRAPSVMTLYFFVMLAILWLWPYSFCEASFQLTFAAILGLSVARVILGNFETNTIIQKIGVSFGFCLFAWLFTAPVVGLWFASFVPLGPLFNLIVIPVFSTIGITFGLITTLLCVVQLPLAPLFMRIEIWLMDKLLLCIDEADRLTNIAGIGPIQVSPERLWVIEGSLLLPIVVTIALSLWITSKKRVGVLGEVW